MVRVRVARAMTIIMPWILYLTEQKNEQPTTINVLQDNFYTNKVNKIAMQVKIYNLLKLKEHLAQPRQAPSIKLQKRAY